MDEILILVNMALGQGGTCPMGLAAGGTPDVSVILEAVNHALNGCAHTGGGLQITIASPGNFNMQRSTVANATNVDTLNIPAVVTATGGTPPYTWTATGLPDSTFSYATDNAGNLVISTTGGYRIGSFTSSVTIKDSVGATVSMNVPLSVGCVLADYSGKGPVHNNNAALAGTYAHLVSGFINTPGLLAADPSAAAGSFTATDQGEDPNTLLGVITGGVEDVSTEGSSGPSSIRSADSRFCIDLDGSGTLVINNVTYRIRGAIGGLGGGAAQEAHVIQFDQSSPTSGELRLQDPAVAFGTGNYVFGLSGRDTQYFPVYAAGDFTISGLQPPGGAGNPNGEADFNDAVLFATAGLGNVKYSPVQITFVADAPNSAFSRYTGSIKATDNSVPEIDFAAYLVPGFVWPGRMSNKSADLFVVMTSDFGPTTGVPFVFIDAVSGKIHQQNLPQPLTHLAVNNQEAAYYRLGAVPPDVSDQKNPNFNTGSAVTIGSIFFDGQFSQYSEDSDIGGTISSTGIAKFTDTSQVGSTGRVTSGPNGPAIGYLWDKSMAVWLDGSPNAAIGELSPLTNLIFQETGQVHLCQGPNANPGTPAFNVPAAAWESPIGVGSVSGGGGGCPNPPATNFGLTGDVNSLLGLEFGVQTGQAGTLSGLPFTISAVNGSGDGLNRFTVGDCPDSSNTGQPCFIGYGYAGLFGEILIETNVGLNDPSGFALGPNKFPLVIVW